MARVDIAILREIVRVISARDEVPDSVDVSKKRFQVTYLEDHKQRIEEALRRNDRDRLNMLYGQLESKVKYQLVRGSGSNAAGERPAAAKAARPTKAPAAKAAKASAPKEAAPPAAKKAAKPAAKATPKQAAKTATARPPKAAAKKPPARSAAKKKK